MRIVRLDLPPSHPSANTTPTTLPMSASSTPRSEALRALASRSAIVPDVPAMRAAPKPTSSYFGSHTFGAKQMRDKLPKEVHSKLTEAIRLGKKLDADIAPAVAKAVKEWAISQ